MTRTTRFAFALGIALATAASAADRPLGPQDAAAGKPLYLQECSGCHGERGRADGPAADFVDPRPRDFTKRLFRLRTTASGQSPATADVLRTIERGIPGSAMPSFAFLSADDRRKVAAYVLQLADLLDEPEPAPVALPAPPAPPTPESLARGKSLYADGGCASCHGDAGKGDGPSAKDLKDADGRPIAARDFTTGVYRGGGERSDLYSRVATGMDGTPMPSFGDVLEPAQLWDVVDYVRSLAAPAPPASLPADPIAAGRVVAGRHACGGCHVLDDGKGGGVGPDLRVSGRKLRPDWVRRFLHAPHDGGKIYPWRVWRMPQIALTDDEIEALVRYLGAAGKQPATLAAPPDPKSFAADVVGDGQLLYMVRCTECHNLGTVVPTPPVKQQGPDLIHVAERLDWEWAEAWILDPTKIDPKTKMTVPGLTPEQVDHVRTFVWKASMEASDAKAR